MTTKRFVFVLLILLSFAVTAAPPEPKVTSLMSKELAGIPGKEGLMLTVEYPPGGADPIHHHNASAFVYGGHSRDASEGWQRGNLESRRDLL
jgi:hypothetical protein